MSNITREDLSAIISFGICLGACFESRWGSCKLCNCGKFNHDYVSFSRNIMTQGLSYTCTCGHHSQSHNQVNRN